METASKNPIPDPQSPIPDLPCVIFAGGKSSRMGRDKALLPFGGYDTLAEYQYRRLLKIFKEVYISAKEDKFPFDAPVIYDRVDDGIFAPTVGLLTVMEALEGDFFALSVDAPFVDEGVILRLYGVYRTDEWDAVAAKTPSGIQPMCAIYTRRLKPLLHESVKEGNHRLGYLLKEGRSRIVEFEEEELFFNMNRPNEYEAAKAALI